MRTLFVLLIVPLALAQGASPALAATSAQLLACHKMLDRQGRGFVKFVANKVGGCADKVVACNLASEIDGVSPSACLSSATTACAPIATQVGDQKAQRAAKIVMACGLVPFAEVQQFVAGLGFFEVVTACSATTINDLVDCVLDDIRCDAEKHLFLADPRAQQSLTAAGVAASFPCVAP